MWSNKAFKGQSWLLEFAKQISKTPSTIIEQICCHVELFLFFTPRCMFLRVNGTHSGTLCVEYPLQNTVMLSYGNKIIHF